jgi:hypothetical protein
LKDATSTTMKIILSIVDRWYSSNLCKPSWTRDEVVRMSRLWGGDLS